MAIKTPVDRLGQPEADEQLMVAVAGGDQRALAALYDRHAPLLLALARRITCRDGEAEDVVHDVFIRVWQRAAEYQSQRGTVATWLRLMTRCRALDRVRSRKRSAQRAERWSQSGVHELVGQPDDRGAERATLREQLARLPKDQLQVLMMSYRGGLSAREIAGVMGIPIGTVKSRMAAGMAKLRRAFQEQQADWSCCRGCSCTACHLNGSTGRSAP